VVLFVLDMAIAMAGVIVSLGILFFLSSLVVNLVQVFLCEFDSDLVLIKFRENDPLHFKIPPFPPFSAF
jgi:hypothetical protein